MPGENKQIKVSILMPIYNAVDTLHECLDSIFEQTLTAFELVAVNDFSCDGSIDILHSYNDPRIRIIENTKKGIVPALNLGLNHCRSDYVARMDADDVMFATRLEKQLAALKQDQSLTLCATQANKFPQEIIQAGYHEYMRWQNGCLSEQDIANDIYIESPFAHPSVMFRKQRVINIGAYIDGDFPEDYELWLRLFHGGEKMLKLDEVLLNWRESDTRLSRNDSRYSLTAFEKLRAEYLAKDPRISDRDIVFWGAGRKTRQRAQHLIDHGIEPSAWIDIDVNKIGNEYLGAKTVSPEWLQDQRVKPFVLNYVRNHGARKYCRQFLDAAAYVRGVDYLDVA